MGSVHIVAGAASFGAVEAQRIAVLGSGARLPGPVEVRSNLCYAPSSTEDTEVDGPLRQLQGLMRSAEARRAQELCVPNTLVVVDGPLGFEPRGLALGYIKRIHKLYLPPRFIPALVALPAGARTPLFAIQTQGSGFARYSWFQRLAAPNLGATEMHGIVRLEVAANIGREAAQGLANAAATWLPGATPRWGRDPRAPQNLLPIGALEQRLRATLGNAQLLRRWIEGLVAREADRSE